MILFKTVVGGNPFTLPLTDSALLRERMRGLVLDSGELIIDRPTKAELLLLEQAVVTLRECWAVDQVPVAPPNG